MTHLRIERSTRAVPGQLKGPAPTAHQVREVSLRVESLPGGGMRVSSPQARGWAVVVRRPEELARAVSSAFLEAQVAAYARWRGERYELDDLTEPVRGDPMAPPRPRTRRRKNTAQVGWGSTQQRPDSHDPAAWVKLPDGRWRSPTGKAWKPDTQVVRKVIARRMQFNLPV